MNISSPIMKATHKLLINLIKTMHSTQEPMYRDRLKEIICVTLKNLKNTLSINMQRKHHTHVCSWAKKNDNKLHFDNNSKIIRCNYIHVLNYSELIFLCLFQDVAGYSRLQDKIFAFYRDVNKNYLLWNRFIYSGKDWLTNAIYIPYIV
jgi:hypothetical protein